MTTSRIVYEGEGIFFINEESATSYLTDLLDIMGEDNSQSVCNMIFTKSTKDGSEGWYTIEPEIGITAQEVKDALNETFGSLRGSDTVTFYSSEGLTFNTLGE